MQQTYQAMIEQYSWEDLRQLWQAIGRRDTPEWEAGKAFEYLVLRAFQLDGAQVRWPYSVRLFNQAEVVEQIDGAVHWEGLSCLVESKDLGDDKIAIAPIAKLRNQLLRRPAGTIGLMFSRTGFTDPARFLAHFALPQEILLWDGEIIEYALQQEKICEFLRSKHRVCVETGLVDYDVREEGT
jgi:hypothetical protein